jgi:nitric oxide dioxygenase
VGYGTRPEHYQTVGQGLLWSLENILGDRWSAQTRQAWTEAYTIMANTMLQGAQPAALEERVI